MFSYTNFQVNFLSFVVSIFIFIIFSNISNFIGYSYANSEEQLNSFQISETTMQDTQENINIDNTNAQNIEVEPINHELSIEESENSLTYEWGISIPKINLTAQIAEGTTSEIMDKYVGHFTDTSTLNGNICLAAHNRGYPVNYFENIKSLEKGDYIIYKLNEETKVYIVETVTVIKDTDWTYLENTSDNRITLITCVENEPEYRRCIQAIEQINGG